MCVRGHICRYDQLLAEYRRGRQYHSDKAAPRADEIAAYAKHLGVGAHAHLRPSLSWVVEEAYADCRTKIAACYPYHQVEASLIRTSIRTC